MKPVIGITPSFENKRYQLNADYMDAVLRAGGLPLILPLTDDPEAVDEALAEVDGLLFSGGADLTPSLYGEETLPVCGETCPMRDKAEMALIRKALQENIPFLAICRGFELMAAALGGTLYQDIASQRPDSVRHPCYDTPADLVHRVTLQENTLLREIIGEAEIGVNSRHHQGAKTLPDKLTVSALAEDGLTEGIELPDHPFAVGVQWHPETLAAAHPEAQRLFDALCRQAETRRLSRAWTEE